MSSSSPLPWINAGNIEISEDRWSTMYSPLGSSSAFWCAGILGSWTSWGLLDGTPEEESSGRRGPRSGTMLSWSDAAKSCGVESLHSSLARSLHHFTSHGILFLARYTEVSNSKDYSTYRALGPDVLSTRRLQLRVSTKL